MRIPLGLPARPRRTAAPRSAGLGIRDPRHPTPSWTGSSATADGHDLAGVPASASGRDRGMRLLHRRHRLVAAAGRAVLHRAGHPASPPGWCDCQPGWHLGRPAGPQPAAGARERGRRPRFVLRDRDAKFSRSFDDVFCAERAEMLVTPVQAPNANAHAERRIRRVRAECLGWLLILGRGHLEQVLRVYMQHYDAHPAHRALALQPPDPAVPLTLIGMDQPPQVHRHDLLGGLVHEYQQAARTHFCTLRPDDICEPSDDAGHLHPVCWLSYGRGVVSHPVPVTGSHLPFTTPSITCCTVCTTTPLAASAWRKSRKALNSSGEIT
jgi:hypothetical protein